MTETENCNLPLLQARLGEVAALGPRLDCLSAEVRSLGAVPSLKDTFVVVSEHHASTQQRLQNRQEQVNEGAFCLARSINVFWKRSKNLELRSLRWLTRQLQSSPLSLLS